MSAAERALRSSMLRCSRYDWMSRAAMTRLVSVKSSCAAAVIPCPSARARSIRVLAFAFRSAIRMRPPHRCW